MIQLDLLTYPHRSGWKSDHASKAAAEKVERTGVCDRLRAIIPGLLLHEPRTAKELAAALNIDKDLVKPRLSELKGRGLVGWMSDSEGYVTRNGEHIWIAL